MNIHRDDKTTASLTEEAVDAHTASAVWTQTDLHYMQLALTLAQQAAEIDEVPVGALLVQFEDNDNGSTADDDGIQGTIIGEGFNRPIANHDPTAHAEIMALRSACTQLHNYRLPKNTTLYVTLEPCTMCVGALIHARLHRLVFATHEPKAGMVGSQHNLLTAKWYNHRVQVESGLLADESSQLLKAFFKARRDKKKQAKKLKAGQQ